MEGADVNMLNKSEIGKTALYVAVCEGNLDIVKYLYENGAEEVCKRNKYSDVTPLHLAALAGKLEIVKYLAGKVDHIDICDQKGNAPLHYAVSEMVSYNSDVIRCLVELGADIHKGNMCGETASYLAAENGKLEVLEYLEERDANFDFQNGNGCAALHCVAKETNLEIKYVAERCSTIDVIDNNGESPVMYAAQKGSLDIVKYLIETKNANAYLCNKNGDTLLHCAAKSGEPQLVDYLFDTHRKLNSVNKNGETPLITAAVNKQWDSVILLTKKHANLHAKKRNGMTVLHIASEQDNCRVVAWLLKKRFSVI
jgi:ankyrin repeat protein